LHTLLVGPFHWPRRTHSSHCPFWGVVRISKRLKESALLSCFGPLCGQSSRPIHCSSVGTSPSPYHHPSIPVLPLQMTAVRWTLDQPLSCWGPQAWVAWIKRMSWAKQGPLGIWESQRLLSELKPGGCASGASSGVGKQCMWSLSELRDKEAESTREQRLLLAEEL
jgi:hypothetical protein